ncbi:MAG TPA: hypothetical protein VJ896_00565 [Bacteroidales bacterium]|nr:hypothetical protein [Bacteroidales bacterium]
MKNILTIFIFFAIFTFGNFQPVKAQSGQELVDICSMIAGDEVTYLKDFPIKLDAAKPGEEPPTARFSVVLSKNTQYRLTICNSKDYSGQAIMQLFDNNRLLGTNFVVATGKTYPSFDFKCTSTGVYHIFVTFKEGEQGLAVSMLSFVKKL